MCRVLLLLGSSISRYRTWTYPFSGIVVYGWPNDFQMGWAEVVVVWRQASRQADNKGGNDYALQICRRTDIPEGNSAQPLPDPVNCFPSADVYGVIWFIYYIEWLPVHKAASVEWVRKSLIKYPHPLGLPNLKSIFMGGIGGMCSTQSCPETLIYKVTLLFATFQQTKATVVSKVIIVGEECGQINYLTFLYNWKLCAIPKSPF